MQKRVAFPWLLTDSYGTLLFDAFSLDMMEGWRPQKVPVWKVETHRNILTSEGKEHLTSVLSNNRMKRKADCLGPRVLHLETCLPFNGVFPL